MFEQYYFYHCKECQTDNITKAKRLQFCERCGSKKNLVIKPAEDVIICDYCKSICFGEGKMIAHTCNGLTKAIEEKAKLIMMNGINKVITDFDDEFWLMAHDEFGLNPVGTMNALKKDVPDPFDRVKFINKMNEVWNDYERSVRKDERKRE